MIDRAFQLAYKAAYKMMRVYWGIARPDTHGALVAVWYQGRILLVKNSYVPYWSLPGGYVHSGETALQAALRELREEVGLKVDSSDLKPSLDVKHEWEGKHDHVEIFALESPQRPEVKIDRREVVDAQLFSPEEAMKMNLFPPIRDHISRYLRDRAN